MLVGAASFSAGGFVALLARHEERGRPIVHGFVLVGPRVEQHPHQSFVALLARHEERGRPIAIVNLVRVGPHVEQHPHLGGVALLARNEERNTCLNQDQVKLCETAIFSLSSPPAHDAKLTCSLIRVFLGGATRTACPVPKGAWTMPVTAPL